MHPQKWLRRDERQRLEKLGPDKPPTATFGVAQALERPARLRRLEEQRQRQDNLMLDPMRLGFGSALVAAELERQRQLVELYQHCPPPHLSDPWTPPVRVEYDVANNKFTFMAQIEGKWVKLVPENEQVEQRLPAQLPVPYLKQAMERAAQSDLFVRLEIEDNGIAVIAMSGDDYETIGVTWEELDKSVRNPLLPAIEAVEKRLAVLQRAKERVAHV